MEIPQAMASKPRSPGATGLFISMVPKYSSLSLSFTLPLYPYGGAFEARNPKLAKQREMEGKQTVDELVSWQTKHSANNVPLFWGILLIQSNIRGLFQDSLCLCS